MSLIPELFAEKVEGEDHIGDVVLTPDEREKYARVKSRPGQQKNLPKLLKWVDDETATRY